MDVIELECPHCGDALELDAAFAGGVCRCSTCGTLMTVPADPSRDRAETLTRRDRPDAPGGPGGSGGGRPDVPGGASSRAEIPGGASSRPDIPGMRPEAPGGASSRADIPPARADAPSRQSSPAAAPATPAAITDELYVTDSGKSLKLAEGVVPTARKRKKVIRATVYATFAAFVIGIVGVIVLAITLLMNAGKKPVENDPGSVGVNPNVNPIKAAEANILGVPVASEAAVVIDATGFARQWYPMVSEIVSHAVSQSSATDYMIIPWTDLNPTSFPGKKPEKIPADKLPALKTFLERWSNVNNASPAAFVELALEQRADQIILIAGRPLEAAEAAAIREAVSKRVDTRLDGIALGGHDEELKKLATENKGKYIAAPVEQVQKWYDEWKKGPAK